MAKDVRSIPAFESEAEERRFWESHDSSDHVDWDKAERVRLSGLRRPSAVSCDRRRTCHISGLKGNAHARD